MYAAILLLFFSATLALPAYHQRIDNQPHIPKECMEEIQSKYDHHLRVYGDDDTDHAAIMRKVLKEIDYNKCVNVEFRMLFGDSKKEESPAVTQRTQENSQADHQGEIRNTQKYNGDFNKEDNQYLKNVNTDYQNPNRTNRRRRNSNNFNRQRLRNRRKLQGYANNQNGTNTEEFVLTGNESNYQDYSKDIRRENYRRSYRRPNYRGQRNNGRQNIQKRSRSTRNRRVGQYQTQDSDNIGEGYKTRETRPPNKYIEEEQLGDQYGNANEKLTISAPRDKTYDADSVQRTGQELDYRQRQNYGYNNGPRELSYRQKYQNPDTLYEYYDYYDERGNTPINPSINENQSINDTYDYPNQDNIQKNIYGNSNLTNDTEEYPSRVKLPDDAEQLRDYYYYYDEKENDGKTHTQQSIKQLTDYNTQSRKPSDYNFTQNGKIGNTSVGEDNGYNNENQKRIIYTTSNKNEKQSITEATIKSSQIKTSGNQVDYYYDDARQEVTEKSFNKQIQQIDVEQKYINKEAVDHKNSNTYDNKDKVTNNASVDNYSQKSDTKNEDVEYFERNNDKVNRGDNLDYANLSTTSAKSPDTTKDYNTNTETINKTDIKQVLDENESTTNVIYTTTQVEHGSSTKESKAKKDSDVNNSANKVLGHQGKDTEQTTLKPDVKTILDDNFDNPTTNGYDTSIISEKDPQVIDPSIQQEGAAITTEQNTNKTDKTVSDADNSYVQNEDQKEINTDKNSSNSDKDNENAEPKPFSSEFSHSGDTKQTYASDIICQLFVLIKEWIESIVNVFRSYFNQGST